MRITRLELVDFKCFEHLMLDNLGDFNVLVGPNGCGKSAILEAIAGLKEFTVAYDQSPHNHNLKRNINGNIIHGWPGTAIPVRIGCDKATISGHFQFDEKEAEIAGIDQVSLEIVIHRQGTVTAANTVPSGAYTVLSHCDPNSGVGVIDYIGPNRGIHFPKVSSFDLGQISLERLRSERIELFNIGVKFSSTKQYIISEELENLSYYNSTGIRHDSLSLLREIFSDFFGPKKLLGYRNFEGEMQVVVETPNGIHDIDQMSSGEKELFAVIVNLFRIRKLPSIILYDEPERHLNAGLESRIIPALEKLQTNNQIWISTHGIELIGSVPMETIISLKREAGRSKPERFRQDASKSERVRLFEAIGAKIGLQLVANRVVFLEGKDSHADKRIIDKLAGPHLPGVLFVASGSSKGVMGAGTRAGEIVTQACNDTAFFMVLDRDFRDPQGVILLETKLKNRAMVWGCHEIENLLLEPSILLKVSKFNGNDNFIDIESVKVELLNVAKSLESRFVAQYSDYQMHDKFTSEADEKDPKLTDELNVIRRAERALERAKNIYSPSAVQAQLDRARNAVQASYEDGTWYKVLPGKEILNGFRIAHFPGVQLDTLKEQIIFQMIHENFIPQEVQLLIKRIKSS